MHTPLHVLVGSLGRGMLPSAVDTEPPKGTVLLDLGPDHPSTKITQGNLATLLAKIASQNAPPPPAPGGGDSV